MQFSPTRWCLCCVHFKRNIGIFFFILSEETQRVVFFPFFLSIIFILSWAFFVFSFFSSAYSNYKLAPSVWINSQHIVLHRPDEKKKINNKKKKKTERNTVTHHRTASVQFLLSGNPLCPFSQKRKPKCDPKIESTRTKYDFCFVFVISKNIIQKKKKKWK